MSYDLTLVLYGGFLLFLTLSGTIVFFVQAYRKKQIEHIAEKSLLLEKFRSTLVSAQLEISEKTMKDISQEIHDNIGQRLTLATLHLRSEKIKTESVLEIIELALSDMRKLSKSLNSSFLEDNGLDMALEREIRIINTADQIKCEYHTSGDFISLSKEQEIIIFRCAQELLSNAIRHSSAKKIIVDLKKTSFGISVSVSDDGTGLLSNSTDGIGISNIHERVSALNGTFEVINRKPSGISGVINIPLNRNTFSDEKN